MQKKTLAVIFGGNSTEYPDLIKLGMALWISQRLKKIG